jgi:hypothetical protein
MPGIWGNLGKTAFLRRLNLAKFGKNGEFEKPVSLPGKGQGLPRTHLSPGKRTLQNPTNSGDYEG